MEDTHYCLGSVMGPHPYPWMVREFQRVVGDEAREQCRALLGGADPDVVVACVGGGSNAAGTFAGFVDPPGPAGRGGGGRGGGHGHGACPGVLHGMRSPCCRTRPGRSSRPSRSRPASTIPGIGPEHAHLAEIGRARYETATDAEVLDAFQLLARTEGIIPALEPAHALAWVVREAGRVDRRRVDGAGHPVGPGGQGRGPGARQPAGTS